MRSGNGYVGTDRKSISFVVFNRSTLNAESCAQHIMAEPELYQKICIFSEKMNYPGICSLTCKAAQPAHLTGFNSVTGSLLRTMILHQATKQSI